MNDFTTKMKVRSILKLWRHEASGFKKETYSNFPVLFQIENNVVHIYSNKPGYLIGQAGKIVYKYGPRLEALGLEYKIIDPIKKGDFL